LGERVLADLTALVDQLYPESEIPDPLDREAADHAAHAASRFAGFVARPALAARLDAHVDDGTPPLLVTGESGVGASALVANWTRAWREAHPDDLVIEHYVGATSTSAEWRELVGRLIGELARGHGFDDIALDDLPDDLTGRRAVLAAAL